MASKAERLKKLDILQGMLSQVAGLAVNAGSQAIGAGIDEKKKQNTQLRAEEPDTFVGDNVSNIEKSKKVRKEGLPTVYKKSQRDRVKAELKSDYAGKAEANKTARNSKVELAKSKLESDLMGTVKTKPPKRSDKVAPAIAMSSLKEDATSKEKRKSRKQYWESKRKEDKRFREDKKAYVKKSTGAYGRLNDADKMGLVFGPEGKLAVKKEIRDKKRDTRQEITSANRKYAKTKREGAYGGKNKLEAIRSKLMDEQLTRRQGSRDTIRMKDLSDKTEYAQAKADAYNQSKVDYTTSQKQQNNFKKERFYDRDTSTAIKKFRQNWENAPDGETGDDIRKDAIRGILRIHNSASSNPKNIIDDFSKKYPAANERVPNKTISKFRDGYLTRIDSLKWYNRHK